MNPPPPPRRQTLTSPPNLFQYHPLEVEHNEWTAVPGADHYHLEYDNEPSFSLPLFNADFSPIPANQTSYPIVFGEPVGDLWFRVRAVAADGTRSVPSNVHHAVITYSAPIPPAPLLTGPPSGSSGTLPVTFDWADDAGPNTYEFQIGSDPTFAQANAAECTGVEWCVRTIPESRWTAPTLTTGTKYWRVRSGHGDISPTEPALVTITATLPTGSRSVQLTVDPPSIQLLTIGALTVSDGDLVGSVTLAGAAPSAGATVTFTSSNPALVPVPSPISIPAGGYTSPLTLRVNPGVRGDYCHDYRNNEFHLLPPYPPPSSHRRLSSRPATARRLPPASPCGSTGRTS